MNNPKQNFVISMFEAKVSQAMTEARGLRCVFSTMLQEPDEIFRDHTGQEAEIIGVGINPDIEGWDEEALPFIKVCFDDGVEAQVFWEELFSQDERFFKLGSAVCEGYGLARNIKGDFLGPYNLAGYGKDEAHRAFLSGLDQLPVPTACHQDSWTPEQFRTQSKPSGAISAKGGSAFLLEQSINHQHGHALKVPSPKLKTQIIELCYTKATLLEGYRFLAGIHPKTGGGIFVVDGIQNRDVYKAMVEEARHAGLPTQKLIVYGYLQTYSGSGIEFNKFDNLGLPELDRKCSFKANCKEVKAGETPASSEIPAFASDLDQQYRYTVPVTSELVCYLPKTDFRPEAMRVTRRESIGGLNVWFEVETYNEKRAVWISQKDHPTAELAQQDAKGWYQDPAATSPENAQPTLYPVGKVFAFNPGDPVIANGYPGTVVRMYSEGMVEVRLPGGLVCIPASYPDCYPAPESKSGSDLTQDVKRQHLSFREVLHTSNWLGHITKIHELALTLGYPYFIWNGRVYKGDKAGFTETGLTTENII